jgi:DNA-binding beta-propeller fold protein YncE
MATVGSGKYTYELIQDWPKLPPGEPLGIVSTVATDSQDRVYAFQRQDPPVMVFDREGNYLNCWGIGAITDPHGMTIADDIVYITDRSDHVAVKFTLDGKPLQVIGNRGICSDTGCEKPGDLVPRAAGPFNYCTEMAPSPSGDIYVSDGYRNARVHRFSSDGQLIQSWGQPGKTEPGHFHLPHSLLVDPEGKVYVCDRANRRVQIFTPEGEFITMWTGMGGPDNIVRDKDGIFYIAEQADESGDSHVSIWDGDGNVLERWLIRHAHGLWVDSHGDIYLGLTLEHSVDKYVRRS